MKKRISIAQKVENFLAEQSYSTVGVVQQYVTKSMDSAKKNLDSLVKNGKATKEYSDTVSTWIYRWI